MTPDKRRAILHAGLELFNKMGFEATSVPLIAKKAGVAVGTIYHHFQSKEAIVNELYQELKADFSQKMLEEFPLTTPVSQQFSEFWRRMTKYALNRPEAFMFVEAHYHAPYLDEKSRQIHMPMLDTFKQAYDTALQQGVIKPLPLEAVIAMLFGSLTALLKSASEGRLELSPVLFEQIGSGLWTALAQKAPKEEYP